MNFSFRRAIILPFLLFCLTFAAAAQDNSSKDEMLNKIAKSSQSKKPEDQAKGYELAKAYLAKYGKDNDDNAKKVKKFADGYRLNTFDKAIDDLRISDAAVLGKEILAENPNDNYVMMRLAFGGFNAFEKKQDKSFAADSIAYAKQALAALDSGNAAVDVSAFKSKDEAAAIMHYIIATFSADTDPKLAVNEFYKSIQYDSQVKKNSYPYYAVAQYYEQVYQKAANDYQAKYGTKTDETDEMKAAEANIEKVIDLMLDAYVRAINAADSETNNQNKAAWQTRLGDVYKFRYKKEDGLAEFTKKTLAAPFPDPNNL